MSIATYYQLKQSFQAARTLDKLGLHGHGFQVTLYYPLATNKQLLQQTIKTLDYQYLNDYLTHPNDQRLSHWLYSQFPNNSLLQLNLQSTDNQGVVYNGKSSWLWKKFRFEAAHQLPNVASDHPCGRMHGHGFEVVLMIKQTNKKAISYDYLTQLWQPLAQQLHHRCLNHIKGLENPTSELLAYWLWQQLVTKTTKLAQISIYETTTAGCDYNGKEYTIWKQQRFESAVDDNKQLYGHSYLIRLYLTAPLDKIMGWTLDYGEVKQVFAPIYRQLDHYNLSLINGLNALDLSQFLLWIEQQLSLTLPQLTAISLKQTPDYGAVLKRNNQPTIVLL